MSGAWTAERQRLLTEQAAARRALRNTRWDADIAANRRPAPGDDFPVLLDAADVAPRRLVYGLTDPREPKRIRYVGQTAVGAFSRYLNHISEARTGITVRRDWMAPLLDAGIYPNMVLLELVAPTDNILAIEQYWIRTIRARGGADLNTPRQPQRRKVAP
jgi:hypothetical protein